MREFSLAAKIALTYIIVGSIILTVELGFRKKTTSTGKVVYLDIIQPDQAGESPYVIFIQRGDEYFAGRVPRTFYKSVKKGEHLLIIDLFSGLTKKHLKTLLFDTQTVLTPISKRKPTLNLKNHGKEVDSSLLYYLSGTPNSRDIHSALTGGVEFNSRSQIARKP